MRGLTELHDMTGRVALITGGGGHIGRAMARSLLQLGCHAILVDRSDPILGLAADELADEANGRLSVITADLEDQAERDKLPQAVRSIAGRLDVLINNAGFVGDSKLSGWVADFEEQSLETWRRAIEVNLTAPFHLAQLFAPMLKAGGHGSIINVASIYGVLGPDLALYEGTAMGNPAGYAASKGGLIQLTRWLATVLAPHIRVNCISPGGLARNQAETFAAKYIDRTPLKRMGVEEDFLGVIAFLASDASAWVTGQNIMVDGGWTAW